jgi:nitroreductase
MEDTKLGSVIDAIRKRRSVRKYRQVPVEKEKIIDIIEAARLAPSASNRQPWRFVTVSDTQLKDKVVKESLGVINQWALSSPLLIVGCSIKRNLITHYLGESITKVRYHIIDVVIAMEHIVLTAEELGLSTCWIGWFNENKIKRILDIPSNWSIAGILAAGYADPDYKPRTQKRHPLKKVMITR